MNGLIEQWKPSVNAGQTISFAITFSNSNYTVTTSIEINGSNATYNISNKKTNEFSIYSNQGSGIKGDLYIKGY